MFTVIVTTAHDTKIEVASSVERATARFRSTFGGEPDGVWVAPGRVNLIGEHTDYNDGFVLPFALPQRTAVAARIGTAGRWRVTSEFAQDVVTFGVPDSRTDGPTSWDDYVRAIVWVLAVQGRDVPGLDLVIATDVPIGAGLSSSAALECAVLAALIDLGGFDVPTERRPRLAQRAENAYVGMPCGIMDQSASVLSRAGHGLFMDCRTLGVEHVPLDATILVVNSNAPHQLADGEYAIRRATCERAAVELGVPALRDATLADVDRLADDVTRRRARHIVTENARVLATVAALRDGDLAEVGALMTASHASMRDDYEITVPEVDLAVEVALEQGAYGARMTGGGFGGCVLALVEPGDVARITAAIEERFADAGFAAPDAFVAVPSAGAHRSR